MSVVDSIDMVSLSKRAEDALIGAFSNFFGAKPPWFLEHFAGVVVFALVTGFLFDVVFNLIRFGPGPMLTLLLTPLARRRRGQQAEDEPATRAVPQKSQNDDVPTLDRAVRSRVPRRDPAIDRLAREKLARSARKREEMLSQALEPLPPRVHSARLEDTAKLPPIPEPDAVADTGPTPVIEMEPVVFRRVSIRTAAMTPEDYEALTEDNIVTEERDEVPNEPGF